MAYVVQGNQIKQYGPGHGPEGTVLNGEGETGLASHTEACQAVRERRSHGTTIGFPDTPEAERVFAELRGDRERQEAQEPAAQPAEGEPPAAAEAPETETEGAPARASRRAPKGG